MARIKHYNHDTGKWEYSDVSYSIQQGSNIDYEEVNELINDAIKNKSDVFHAHTIDDVSGLRNTLNGKSDNFHSHTVGDITGLQNALDAKANRSDIPTSLPASDVHEWAKASTKPSYTAQEVGAAPSTHTHTASEVGAEPANTVSAHNVATDAHNDIRVVLGEFKTAVENFLDINDEEFNQLSELIEKIKENAGTITQLTNGKVNIADIVDNLETNVSNKPLSAAQGVALKALIDALQTAVNGKAASTDLTSHTGNTSNPHGVTARQVGALSTLGGSMSGEIDMGGNYIIGAANVGLNADNSDGDSVSVLTLQPVLSEEDNSVYLYLQDEYNGFHTVGIQNVASPIDNNDAANKSYVDEEIVSSINAIPQIYTSTSEPTSAVGKNGDIWIVYKE
jgi:hypothetical protein